MDPMALDARLLSELHFLLVCFAHVYCVQSHDARDVPRAHSLSMVFGIESCAGWSAGHGARVLLWTDPSVQSAVALGPGCHSAVHRVGGCSEFLVLCE